MTQRVLVRFTADRAVLPGVVAYPKAEVCVVETTYDRLCHMMVLSSHCRLLTTEEAGMPFLLRMRLQAALMTGSCRTE